MSTEKTMEEMQNQFMAAYQEAQMETYDDAVARKAQEEAENNNGGVPFFATKTDGDYSVRILPHSIAAINAGARGYSQSIKQFWLEIEKAGVKKPVNVKVVDARQCGFSLDLLQTFKYIAVGKLKAQIAEATGNAKKDLEKKLAIVDSGSYNKGLRFDYKHIMYLTETSEAGRKEGIKMFEASNGLFKSIEEAKMKIWSKRIKNNPKEPCPISSPFGANPVMITRKTVNKKTEYSILVDVEEGKLTMTEAEVKSLQSLPALASYLKYNKRSFQATLIFLSQYDAKHGLGVLTDEKFVEAAEKLKAELDANKEDTSSFDLDAAAKSADGESGEAAEDGILIDDLFGEFELLREDGVEDGDPEMTDFRKKIRAYISQEGMPFRVPRDKSTEDILKEIDDYVAENGERGVVSASSDAGEEVKPREEATTAAVTYVEEDGGESGDEDEAENAPVEEPVTTRTTRAARTPRTPRTPRA